MIKIILSSPLYSIIFFLFHTFVALLLPLQSQETLIKKLFVKNNQFKVAYKPSFSIICGSFDE
ncbi:hypothetical protein BVRB_6g147730 [Beta vulgaris subsp. vulgaris]|nr:hypothetical protein BVRB_6g147730 [Beta vulgaris subsp. vulgaris]